MLRFFGWRLGGNDKDQDEQDSCRRDEGDRRQDHRKALLYSTFKRRRRGPRRDEDLRRGHYVDIHEPGIVVLTLGIVLLCVADAFFTLNIIARGGEELNPFMRSLLDRNVLLFFSVKFTITSLCLVFTIVHKHFRVFRMISGYHILYSVFICYASLIYYEMYLLNFDFQSLEVLW
ncbi:MAG: DUF5658 family protein [Gammaproteobacteria bacterium]|nr:DUF5658 family protein [Gammaproteobacteria bacterium]